MPGLEACLAILDSFDDHIIFVDTEHVIRYLNPAAEVRFADRGGAALVGRSLLDCHAPESRQRILEIYQRLQGGEDEIFLTMNNRGENVYVVAVRGRDGKMLGYYERFEEPLLTV